MQKAEASNKHSNFLTRFSDYDYANEFYMCVKLDVWFHLMFVEQLERKKEMMLGCECWFSEQDFLLILKS